MLAQGVGMQRVIYVLFWGVFVFLGRGLGLTLSFCECGWVSKRATAREKEATEVASGPQGRDLTGPRTNNPCGLCGRRISGVSIIVVATLASQGLIRGVSDPIRTAAHRNERI